MTMWHNETIDLLLAHTSIRKFEEKDIELEKVEAILAAAKSASTSSFLQAYSILMVSQGQNRDLLANLCGDQDYVAKAPVFMVFLADLHRLHKMCDRHKQPYAGGWTETLLIGTVDAALAGQNALVAAESMGLGGVYIGGIRNRIAEVSELLKLPSEVYPVFGLCIGYPDQNPGVKERLPNELLVHQEVYQEGDEAILEAYDARIKDYYLARTRGKVNTSWSEGVAEKLSKEMRPHMHDYLSKRGLLLK